MEHVTHEITQEYRLDFEGGEAGWDDPIPPEVTSRVLGREATCTINRTSLLAWSLMNIAHVQVADLACGDGSRSSSAPVPISTRAPSGPRWPASSTA